MTAAIIGVVAALLGGLFSYAATQSNNSYNKQQYDDWKQYNDPEHQMQRYEDAGLNKYLVAGGVNNTISQPYQAGNNQGIAQALQGIASGSVGAGNLAETSRHNRATESLTEDRIENERAKINLQKIGNDLRERMVKIAEKKGDAQAALLWSQGSIADLNKQFLKRSLPYRVGDEFYDYLLKQQMYAYNESMNPLKLSFYPLYNQALINNLNARSSKLAFDMDFAKWRWMMDNYHWNQQFGLQNKRFGMDYDIANRRLDLSNRYKELADRKFIKDIIMDTWSHGLDTYKAIKGVPHVTRKIQKTAGGYPTVFEYEYGY